MTEYKDWFTLDGRLPLTRGVTQKAVEHMTDLVGRTVRGDRLAAATLSETMTTSDAPLAFAQVVNLNVFQKFDEAPRTWTQIATRRSVSNFQNITFYSLDRQWNDGTLGDGEPRHISPVIPETVAYPYAALAGESYEGNALVKRGFKVGLSWEFFINDTIGYVRDLPNEILRVALDTEEYEVYNALIGGVGVDEQLDAATNPDGTAVVANSPLTRAALIAAQAQLGQREIDGRKVVVNGGYNLIVAPGQRANAEFQINNTLLTTVTTGTSPELQFSTGGYNPLASISVIESEYVSGSAWYLVPKPGQRRPVLELAALTGHEAPELRISTLTGTALGGSALGPYSGGFDNDTIDLRVRQVIKGLNWTKEMILWSDGTGS